MGEEATEGEEEGEEDHQARQDHPARHLQAVGEDPALLRRLAAVAAAVEEEEVHLTQQGNLAVQLQAVVDRHPLQAMLLLRLRQPKPPYFQAMGKLFRRYLSPLLAQVRQQGRLPTLPHPAGITLAPLWEVL